MVAYCLMLGVLGCSRKRVPQAHRHSEASWPTTFAQRYALRGYEVGVNYETAPDGYRDYVLSSTQPLRQATRPEGRRSFEESPGELRLRSSDPLVDAVFALALTELRAASVTEIQDGAFKRPFDCNCFETGAQWHFVWTRDTAYATDLGLRFVDANRAARSLAFRMSRRRDEPEGAWHYVQDTGTGGSFPVSTDRVALALGAASLEGLGSATYMRALSARHTSALIQAAESSRHYQDGATGLYRGEQSFLDWREQSQAHWIAQAPSKLAETQSLSTNVLHWHLLSLAARAQPTADFDARADALAEAIRTHFFDQATGKLHALIGPADAPFRWPQQALLGTSLAILAGLLTPEDAQRALANYPRAPEGSPVLWPVYPDRPVYHNQAIWPFVSSYAALAADRKSVV